MSMRLYPSGREVDPLHITIDDIDVVDTAHALSQITRFNGHISERWSVGQHVLVCKDLAVDYRDLFADLTSVNQTVLPYAVLHHDDEESFLGDVTRTLKYSEAMVGYRALEASVGRLFNAKWSIWMNEELHTAIKVFDNLVVQWEADIFKHHQSSNRYIERYRHLSPLQVREAYLKAHHEWQPISVDYYQDRDMSDETQDVCPYDPRLVTGPIGMFHCPGCGFMQIAGCPHIGWKDELGLVIADVRD